jgi:hypothetical protein
MDEAFIPTLSYATERDIDLLLVEELHASIEFIEWIASHVHFCGKIASWDVKHSKRRTRSRREIDIFVEIRDREGRLSALLIENKLDAAEQPDQAESYREELAVMTPSFPHSAMIIVCPEAYKAECSRFVAKFDAVITYEEIASFFREMQEEVGSDLILRYQFRAGLLEQAVHKNRRGYTAVPDAAVGDFNARYVLLLADLAPEILPGPSMLKPENPRESTSMIFDQAKSLAGLPEELRPRRFAHELGRGSSRRANYVAVTFAGWGAALPTVIGLLQADTKEIGAFFEAKYPNKARPNPGLVMALATEPVDNQGTFSSQYDALERGIATAQSLRLWLLQNQKVIAGWKETIENASPPPE